MEWKNTSEEYLFYKQKFLDLCDNIEDENLKKQIIYTMLNCDECLTKLAEEQIKNINNK